MYHANHYVAALLLLLSILSNSAQCETLHKFERVLLSEEFCSEGACFADINGDGYNDVVSGPYWYVGPEFRTRYSYAASKSCPIKGYSEYFFTFADDFNDDGRPDVLAISMPGQDAYWFENPFTKNVAVRNVDWKRRLAVQRVSNESPIFKDIDGDQKNELVFIQDGAFGYAGPSSNVDQPWAFVPITDNLGLGVFTHGMGVDDVNGDGRPDLLETNGWWEQTATRAELFRFHRQRFAQSGGAQMHAFDIDGDGDNDVVSTQNAHAYGLSWFEQIQQDGEIAFVEHPILTSNWKDNEYGLAISQMHAVAVADVDQDGVKDIITGKRYWAHGGNDPGAREANVLYWFRTVRPNSVSANGSKQVRFEPHLIDVRSGVGTQLTVGDVSANGLNDVVVGNKLGTFVMLHSAKDVSNEAFEQSQPKPSDHPAFLVGTSEFTENVRRTDPQSAADEQKTFVLPPGFSIDLVASDPVIGQPMNLAFDAKGRLWVSSSVEYPFGAQEGKTGRDTIKIFEDADNDGTFETVKTFADDLDIPIGLLPYKNGAICFSIPNIWYFEDTDGDDRADKRTILYGPFDTTRDRHGMCNAFVRASDGWVYACHGFSNNSQVAGADGHSVTMRSGNVFRFRLDGSRIEHFAHGQVNPFGMTIDRWGDIFTADCHTKPINLVLHKGYHESFGAPHDGLGFVPNVMEHLHGSTGIGGVALGADTAFPKIYQSSTFGCNVVTSRINRNSLQRTGSSISAREEPDFLTSNDPWFRPVFNIVGPDGALYVADFYNAIIGHYEVDLHHPKRDRNLGRVWRIKYDAASDVRRDEVSLAVRIETDLTRLTLEQLIDELRTENESRARLIIDQISDRYSHRAESIRQHLNNATDLQRVRLLWCLHRLGSLSDEDITAATRAESALVRVHGYRMLEARSKKHIAEANLVANGLADAHPLVQRAAVMVARARPDERFVPQLLAARAKTPKNDVHLHHALKMALGYNLRDEQVFEQVATSLASETDREFVAELCEFLRTDASGRFLVRHLTSTNNIDLQKLRRYLQLAARYVDDDSSAKIVTMIRQRFADDVSQQIALLNEMRTGLSAQSKPLPNAVRQMAIDIAMQLFTVADGEAVSPIGWKAIADPVGNSPRPFAVSTRRPSADGMQNTPMWSSLPNGEAWTGIYRSGAFSMPPQFSFFVAGHDGFPSAPLQGKNVVRLRDASTLEILRSETPRRNDTAQQIAWDTSELAGRQVFVEIVDGDAATAYAWLAVGRFSMPELNPSLVPQRRVQAAAIVQEFGLVELRQTLTEALPQHVNDPITAKALAVALVSVSNDASTLSRAIAASIDLQALNNPVRKQTIEALTSPNLGEIETLTTLMKLATSVEQNRIADELCRDSNGASALLNLVAQGSASPRLLANPRRAEILKRLLDETQSDLASKLSAGAESADAKITELIASRKQEFLQASTNKTRGQAVFEKNCIACHQVGKIGKPFAPNLDGIGNRGLDRLLEDVLDPDRNVDHAFRATTIVTDGGKVLHGLAKDANDNQVRIVDSTGVEHLINRDAIEDEVRSNRSPMPANLGETLSKEELVNLMAYLLSLTNA
ncbi:MAG: VCBS repeat-containing protein [Planctomycetales bacterium]|nr:VCBS repeat-containing protein [Planctomycetales bacterium]